MKGLNNDQISEVFKKGQVVSSPFFVIKYLLNKDFKGFEDGDKWAGSVTGGVIKTSFIVGKKDYKKATQRNYYRRVYREAYQRALKELGVRGGGDAGGVSQQAGQKANPSQFNIVVTIRKNKNKIIFTELASEFLKSLKRIYNI